MDTQRLILLVALGLILTMIYSAWQQDYGPRPVPVTASGAATGPEAGPADGAPHAARGAADAALPEAPAAPGVPAAAPVAQAMASGERIRVTTDLLDVEIDTVGGDLRRIDLLAYPVAVDQPDVPFELMYDEGDRVYIAQSGLVAVRGAPKYHTLDHNIVYSAPRTSYELRAGEDQLQIPLTWTHESGLQVTKLLTFHRDSYIVDTTYRVENRSDEDWEGSLYGQFQHSPVRDEDTQRFIYTFTGGALSGPETHYEKISFDDMADEPLSKEVQGGWAALIQHYFVAAWLPDQEQSNHYYTKAVSGPRYVIGSVGAIGKVAAGDTGEFSSRLYAGPKEQKRLTVAAPFLDLTVDYGYLTVLAQPIFWLLTHIHDFVGNWGWSIILLTILIKLAFFHLSATSYKSMAHMRKVQPRLKALKERFGDDKQKLNQAMMELYKKEKINPLGGCLPILVQIPVFIALYWVLLESVEMRQAPFMLWIQNLSGKDPYFILPLIMGITMFIQQRLNPAPVDPVQAKVMMALPFVFTIFFAFFPAGLVLYWVTNNTLSIAQQWYITRKMLAN